MVLQLAPKIVADIEWAVVSLTGLIAVVSLVSCPVTCHFVITVLLSLSHNNPSLCSASAQTAYLHQFMATKPFHTC
jgi:hypothetical protein